MKNILTTNPGSSTFPGTWIEHLTLASWSGLTTRILSVILELPLKNSDSSDAELMSSDNFDTSKIVKKCQGRY